MTKPLEETVYDADRQLRHPRRFFRRALSELSAATGLSRRLLVLSLRARYRQSVLGYLWLLATPVSIAAVWVFLHQTRLLQFGATPVPYAAYVTTGVLLWTAFLRMLNAPLQQLQGSRGVLSKIGFPWEALLLVGWGEAIVEAFIYLVVIAGVHALFGIPVATIVIAVPAVIALLLLGAAIGISLAPLGVLYEDVPRAVGMVTYLLFFLTPIVYPVPKAMPGSITVLANPVALLLVSAREMMTAQPISHPLGAMIAGALTVLLLISGWIAFRLSIPHLVSKL